jgi:hypothetical protein
VPENSNADPFLVSPLGALWAGGTVAMEYYLIARGNESRYSVGSAVDEQMKLLVQPPELLSAMK